MRTVRSIEKQILHGVDFDNILVSDSVNLELSECDNLSANTKRGGRMEMIQMYQSNKIDKIISKDTIPSVNFIIRSFF